MLDERLLQRVQLAVRAEPLDRGDRATFVLDRQRQAREDSLAVDQHRAGAARALVAALLRAREPEPLPEHVEQALARLQLERVLLAVDPQAAHRQSTETTRKGLPDRPD